MSSFNSHRTLFFYRPPVSQREFSRIKKKEAPGDGLSNVEDNLLEHISKFEKTNGE